MRRLLVALALLLATVTPSHAIEVTGGGVTSLTGTANQVTVSAPTGAVTLSLPDPLTPPGTLAMGANAITSTGVVNAGTFVGVTSATVPTVIGGTAVGSSLNLQSTSGVGTTDFIRFLVGNNGATEAMRIINDGKVGIGVVIPTNLLDVRGGRVRFTRARTDLTGNSQLQLTGVNSGDVIGFEFSDGVNNTSLFGFQDGASIGSTFFYWMMNTTELARLTGSGLFGLGMTPTAKLDITVPVNTVGIGLSGYSLTGSSAVSMVSQTGTLNTSGNPDVWLLDLTNTASGATTKAMNVKVGGSSVFSVDMAGAVIAASTYTSGSSVGLTATTTVRAAGGLSDCTLIFTGGLKTGGTC